MDVLVRELLAREHSVGLVANADSAAPATCLFAWPGKTSQQRRATLLNMFALWRAVREFKPDLLHSFSRALYLIPLLHGRMPKIMSYQRRPGRRQVAAASRLGGTSLIFTGCSEHICKAGRASGGTWHAIHNCVDLKRYTFRPSVATDAPLVFLSRVERIKGAHTAIEIARRAQRRLLVAGNHLEAGDQARYWETEIKARLGKDGVEYVGPVDDEQKNRLLGQAAALLVPIEWDEPFGIVFVESLACGTPVISRPLGALPEIVKQGENGFLGDTVDEICGFIGRLGEIDRAYCRAEAERRFSDGVIVSAYERLYRSLLS